MNGGICHTWVSNLIHDIILMWYSESWCNSMHICSEVRSVIFNYSYSQISVHGNASPLLYVFYCMTMWWFTTIWSTHIFNISRCKDLPFRWILVHLLDEVTKLNYQKINLIFKRRIKPSSLVLFLWLSYTCHSYTQLRNPLPLCFWYCIAYWQQLYISEIWGLLYLAIPEPHRKSSLLDLLLSRKLDCLPVKKNIIKCSKTASKTNIEMQQANGLKLQISLMCSVCSWGLHGKSIFIVHIRTSK